jgi:23S rRNA (cytidine1920-2'-O)/16S rRNA (cytidine1409-2'-O)-methyltransferase
MFTVISCSGSSQPVTATPSNADLARSQRLKGIALMCAALAIFSVLDEVGSVVCLIKPQFELRREDITRGGIVRDPALHQQAIEKIRHFATAEHHCEWLGLIPSPITGTDGNQEFLAWIRRPEPR